MSAKHIVYTFEEHKSKPDPVFSEDRGCLEPVPLVVDNGSFQCRAGWASGSPQLVFRSVAARSRGAARGDALVGNDIPNLEPVRATLKSAFDRDAVVNLDIQELVLDYIFSHVGISSQGSVEHPLVVTEAVCNPLLLRQSLSELLFECYGVPRVAYGVDSLFSFYGNTGADPAASGLVLSSGHHCSHVLPVVSGRLDAWNCKRVNVGGAQAAAYLQRLMQLKYPANQAAVTLSRMEEVLHTHCCIAEDYQHELERWRNPEFFQQEVRRFQLPYTGRSLGSCISAEERNERRAQQIRRLQEINSRRREEKLQEDQRRLQSLLAVQGLLEHGSLELFHRSLQELNMDSAEELQSYIHKLSISLQQQRLLRAQLNSANQSADAEPSADEGKDLEAELQENDEPSSRASSSSQTALSVAEYHQLLVGTERLRVPEIIFQPSLIGEEQMGLMECVQFVLQQYSPEQQEALVQNVFLTGGNLQYPGVKERVERELRAIRPFQSHFQVNVAARPSLDGWFGAREWALRNPPGTQGWISREDYEEQGGEYLKEHCASNRFISLQKAKLLLSSEPSDPEALSVGTEPSA
ncbi:hypothetical protein DNTS_003334 [Danionella cerebrum]|uniref:Actin-related protein 5 n=1 Tax=Danionella cerebrum TaxID=2873325 RepID=A0A553QNW2_9TELE|nr:hypothetical protein DNTS_003334 [Danionella translucida]